MQGNDVGPLLIRHLVDDGVPGVSGVVDNDVDLAAAEVSGFLDEPGNVVRVQDVADHGDGLAAILLDLLNNTLCLLCAGMSVAAVPGRAEMSPRVIQ